MSCRVFRVVIKLATEIQFPGCVCFASVRSLGLSPHKNDPPYPFGDTGVGVGTLTATMDNPDSTIKVIVLFDLRFGILSTPSY
jgi:hypothetical protein